MLFRARMHWRLTLVLIGLSLFPVIASIPMMLSIGQENLAKETLSNLAKVRDVKLKQINDLAEVLSSSARSIAQSPQVKSLLLSPGLPGKELRLDTLWAQQPALDMFDGLLVFDAIGAMSLSAQPKNKEFVPEQLMLLAEQEQNHLIESARTGIRFSDFQRRSLPSGEQKIWAFVAAPVHHAGRLLGVIMLRFDHSMVSHIMAITTNLGKTAEVYLVGSDMQLRAAGFRSHDPQSHIESFRSPQLVGLSGPVSRRALNGQRGTDIFTNSLGHEIFAAYTQVDWGGLSYALLVQLQSSEVLVPLMAFDKTGVLLTIAALLIISFIAWSLAGHLVRVRTDDSQLDALIETGASLASRSGSSR